MYILFTHIYTILQISTVILIFSVVHFSSHHVSPFFGFRVPCADKQKRGPVEAWTAATSSRLSWTLRGRSRREIPPLVMETFHWEARRMVNLTRDRGNGLTFLVPMSKLVCCGTSPGQARQGQTNEHQEAPLASMVTCKTPSGIFVYCTCALKTLRESEKLRR